MNKENEVITNRSLFGMLLIISILVCMSFVSATIISSNEELLFGDTNVRGCYQKGQQFYLNSNKDMVFTGIELYGSRFGNATGNIEFELRKLDCNGQPLGELLSIGNKNISELSDVDGWFSVQMERVNLSYNIMYGIIWKYIEGNEDNYFHQRVNWNNDTSGLLYASVLHKQCNDSWESVRHEDFLFRIIGEEIPEEEQEEEVVEQVNSGSNNQGGEGSSGGGSSYINTTPRSIIVSALELPEENKENNNQIESINNTINESIIPPIIPTNKYITIGVYILAIITIASLVYYFFKKEV